MSLTAVHEAEYVSLITPSESLPTTNPTDIQLFQSITITITL